MKYFLAVILVLFSFTLVFASDCYNYNTTYGYSNYYTYHNAGYSLGRWYPAGYYLWTGNYWYLKGYGPHYGYSCPPANYSYQPVAINYNIPAYNNPVYPNINYTTQPLLSQNSSDAQVIQAAQEVANQAKVQAHQEVIKRIVGQQQFQASDQGLTQEEVKVFRELMKKLSQPQPQK